MKKHFLTLIGLVTVAVMIIFALALIQTSLFGSNRATSLVGKITNLSRGGGNETAANFKMAVASQDLAAPLAAAPAQATPVISRKITKMGNLSLLVETAETAVINIQAIAESMTGYVSDTNIYETSPGVKSGSVTIRVPADKFDQTMSRLKELAIKVESESVNANDVTDQYIDLNARLNNLKAEEAQYLSILKRAQKIEDIINVTSQLNNVRQQIDSWQGQLKYLNSQVDLSTITINLTAEKEVQIFGINWRPMIVINQALHSLFAGLVNYANAIIALIIFLPVIALWLATALAVVWLVWYLTKVAKNKNKTKKKISSRKTAQ